MKERDLYAFYEKNSVLSLSETEKQELSKNFSNKITLDLENFENFSPLQYKLLANLINKNSENQKTYHYEENNQNLESNKKSYTLTLQFLDFSTEDVEVHLTNSILKINDKYYILKNYLQNTKAKGGFGSVKEIIASIELDEYTSHIKSLSKMLKKQYVSRNDPESSQQMVNRETRAIEKIYDYKPEILKRQAKKGDCIYFTMPKFSDNQLYHHTFTNNLNKKITDLKKLMVCINFLTALKKVHSKGLIHLDIKPSNIMLDDTTGEVNIVDFGTTREIGSDIRLSGTKEFIAPELSKKIISTAAESMDIFSAAGTCATIFSLDDHPRSWKKAIEDRSKAKNYQQRRNTPFNFETVEQLSFDKINTISIKNILKYMGSLDQKNRVHSLNQVLTEFERIFASEFALMKIRYQDNINAAVKAIKAAKLDHKTSDQEKLNLSLIQQQLLNLEKNSVNSSDIYQLDNDYQTICKNILQLNNQLTQQIEFNHAKNYYEQLICSARESIREFYLSKKITRRDDSNILDTIDNELDELQNKLIKINDVNDLDRQYRTTVAKISKLASENTCSSLKNIINKIFNILNSINIHCYRPNILPDKVQQKLDIMKNSQRFFSYAKIVIDSNKTNSEAKISKRMPLAEP